MWLKFAALVVGIAGAAAILPALGLRWEDLQPEQIRSVVLSFGWWSPVIYIAIFAQPIIPLPASVMAMAGGLSFGLLGGFVTVLGAATLRACGQFLLAKVFGREAIASLLKGRLAGWDRRVGEAGFLTVLWIRIVPNVPYDLQNFGLGFSRIGFGPFALATFLGLIPGVFLWVYLGHTLADYRRLWKVAAALLGVLLLWLLQRFVRGRPACRGPLEAGRQTAG